MSDLSRLGAEVNALETHCIHMRDCGIDRDTAHSVIEQQAKVIMPGKEWMANQITTKTYGAKDEDSNSII